MAIRFIPTQTFLGVVNGRENRYVKGYGYTVRDPEIHQRHLLPKVQEWEKQGFVRIVGDVSGGVAGTAERKTGTQEA